MGYLPDDIPANRIEIGHTPTENRFRTRAVESRTFGSPRFERQHTRCSGDVRVDPHRAAHCGGERRFMMRAARRDVKKTRSAFAGKIQKRFGKRRAIDRRREIVVE